MGKLFLLLALLLLLSLACGGTTSVWQPASRTVPQFEVGSAPKLFLWDRVSLHTVNVHDLASEEVTKETMQTASDLATVVSEEYQVIGFYVMQRQGPYFINQGGHTSPNGLWLAYEEISHFSLRRTDGAGMLTLSRAGSWFSPVWSPDSQWLAYADFQGVWAVDMRELSPRPLLNRAAAQPLAWSADNQQLLLRDGNALVILDIAAQTERTVDGVDAAAIHGQPAWSPDGQTIYAAYGENGRSEYNVPLTQLLEIPLARLVAISTTGGRNAMRDLLPAAKDQGIIRFILSPDGQAIVADHVFCSKRASGLIPLLSTWGCDQSLLAVETAGGAYVTIQKSPERVMAWERPWPPVNLADLPLPPEPIPAPPEAAYTPKPWPTVAPASNFRGDTTPRVTPTSE